MKKVILLSVSILLISLAYSFAEVPCKINYQGRLIKDNVPVDGTNTMVFSIYAVATGGSPIWTSENVSVEVHNGLFRYVIGSDGGDLSSIDWTAGQALYLQVMVDGETLTPREELSAYPYAINSHLLEGRTKEYFINTSGETQTKQGNLNIIGNVGIGTTSPSEDLHVYRGDNDVARIYATGSNQGAGIIYVGQSPTYGGGIAYDGDGNPDIVGGNDRITFFRRSVGTDTEVFSYLHNNNNVGFAGNVGIGTTGPNDKLEISNGAVRFGVGNYKTGSVEKGRIFIDTSQTISGFSNDAWIFEKSDGNNANPDSPIAFVTVGNDDVVRPRLVIQGSGNVGIGTTSPGAKLDVQGGAIKATGGLIIETRTSDPTPPATGQMWLRTD